MKRRNILPRLEAALADTPVVLVNGPRQTGKTTLVKSLAGKRAGVRYFTFDDAAVLAAAAADPPGFISGTEGLTIIDEVQKVLYGGDTVVPIGDPFDALPVSALWSWRRR
jgi:hypothetical protein